MAGPWERYAEPPPAEAPAPWERYQQSPDAAHAPAAPTPWEKYRQPNQAVAESFATLPPDRPLDVSRPPQNTDPSKGPVRITVTPSWFDRAIEASKAVTDIPGEAWRTTRDQALDAAANLNPFSQERREANAQGSFFDPYLKTGKGLFEAATLPAAPIMGALTAIVGHPWSAITDEPYDDPANKFSGKNVAGTALWGLGARGGRPVMAGQPAPPVPPPSPPGTLRSAAQTTEKIFSPETVDANAGKAVELIRAATGKAARDTAITDTALEPFHARVNALPDGDRLNFINHVETRSTPNAPPLPPELRPIADELRTAFEQRRQKIDALPEHQGMAFVEDYFPHFWKDPNAAAAFTERHFGGAAKQGSGASLKKRTMPTIADGIAAGLQPITTNPIEAALRYVHSMDLFIASAEIRNQAKDLGLVKYIRPKIMGASGHPESFKAPAGWVPLEGRGSRNAVGAQAYAPEGFARVYNNFLSRGVAQFGQEYGSAMDGARRVSNSITALELGLSGYHALTMAQESMVNSLANALSNLRAGSPIKAAKNVAEIPVAPVSYAVKGKRLQDVYLNKRAGTPEMQEIAKLLEEGGGRGKGARHAPDYEFSGQGSYVTAFKRGALKAQLIADSVDVARNPLMGPLKVGARHMGRIMDTVAQPLFEKYIPLLKNGAFYENMRAWLEQNPGAPREQQVRAARQILDSVDNRFGEMVQDNVFWNRALKEVAMLTLRSWSWTVGGSFREIGGGVRDVARAPFKKVDPANNIAPNDKRWTQKMDYAIALPLVFGGLSAVIQGLMTGKPPEDVRDLLAPRTGGTDANSGEPERLLVPGYMKDVFGFTAHPVQELTNKVATGPRMVKELMFNKNWRDDPIRSPRSKELDFTDQAPIWLKDYFKYATETLGPITVRNIAKGQKEGSAIPAWLAATGVRTSPRYLMDPEGYTRMQETVEKRAWDRKRRFEIRDKLRYGGTE